MRVVDFVRSQCRTADDFGNICRALADKVWQQRMLRRGTDDDVHADNDMVEEEEEEMFRIEDEIDEY